MPAPAARPSRACAMPPETHCLARAERSGPTVAPCQTSPTPAREVPRLAGRRHAGNLSGLATCNAARSSTGTGFAGIANLPAHPLLRACCLQSARSAQVRPLLPPAPFISLYFSGGRLFMASKNFKMTGPARRPALFPCQETPPSRRAGVATALRHACAFHACASRSARR